MSRSPITDHKSASFVAYEMTCLAEALAIFAHVAHDGETTGNSNPIAENPGALHILEKYATELSADVNSLSDGIYDLTVRDEVRAV